MAKGFIIPENDPNRQKCEKSIKAYDDFKAIADEYRKTYLSNLPSVSDVSRDNAEKIDAARKAYDNLGKGIDYAGATKNIQSFIDKKELTQLKNLEKQRDKNIKAALKVTNLIAKLAGYKPPFDSKQAKAIDAAWKAYEKLGSDAVRSFVEHVETLNWCYERLHTPLAYVGKGLDVAGAELAEDDGANYTLTIWVDGVEKAVCVTKADAQRYFTENFKAGFYAFQRVEIGGVTVMRVVTAPGGFENRFLNQPNECYLNGTIIMIGEEPHSLADNCALYGIRDGKVEEIDASELEDGCNVYVDLNGQDQAAAIYAVLGAND